MTQSLKDKFGNQIYITDERWEHIHKRHPETIGYEKQIIKTVRSGDRSQLPLEPDVFKYKKSVTTQVQGLAVPGSRFKMNKI